MIGPEHILGWLWMNTQQHCTLLPLHRLPSSQLFIIHNLHTIYIALLQSLAFNQCRPPSAIPLPTPWASSITKGSFSTASKLTLWPSGEDRRGVEARLLRALGY